MNQRFQAMIESAIERVAMPEPFEGPPAQSSFEMMERRRIQSDSAYREAFHHVFGPGTLQALIKLGNARLAFAPMCDRGMSFLIIPDPACHITHGDTGWHVIPVVKNLGIAPLRTAIVVRTRPGDLGGNSNNLLAALAQARREQ
jgi:hypothetical protein